MARITADRNYAQTHVDLFFEISRIALAPDSGIAVDSAGDQIFYSGARERIEPLADKLRGAGVQIEYLEQADLKM